MLLLPLSLGLAAAGRIAAPALWAAVGMLLLFLMRSASVPAGARLVEGRAMPQGFFARRLFWSALYGTAAAGCFVAALGGVDSGRRPLALIALIAPFGLGGVHAALGLLGRDRSLAAEIVGMTGLAASAPLVAVTAGAPAGGKTSAAAALSLAYFLSSLAFVRAYRKQKSAGRIATGACLYAHAAIVAALVALAWGSWIPALALLAFAPVLARTLWGLAFPPRNLAQLGWREVGVAATFLVAASAALLA